MDERARTIDQTVEKLRIQLEHARELRREYDMQETDAPKLCDRDWPASTRGAITTTPGHRAILGSAGQDRGNAVVAAPESPSITKRLHDLREAVAASSQLAEALEQRLDAILTPNDAPPPSPTTESGPGGYRLIADDIGATTYDVQRVNRLLERIHRRINL